MKPEFICIGAQKAGTTWLYSNLKLQPEFRFPYMKEIHYFDRSERYPTEDTLACTGVRDRVLDTAHNMRFLKRFSKALLKGSLKKARWWIRYSYSTYSDSWYLSLFGQEPGFTGDITPSYSVLEESDVARMHALLPDVKIIFMMRNPIDRAWSAFRFRERYGLKIDLEGLDTFKKIVNGRSQELRGDYLRTIDLFSKYFDRENILLGFYDAIIHDPVNLLTEVTRHIGATEPVNQSGLKSVVNRAVSAKIPPTFHALLKEKYERDIEVLAKRYGGYATAWHQALSGQGEQPDLAQGKPPPTCHPAA